MKFKLLAFITCCFWSQLAYSWNAGGHQVIAAMTWDLLSAEQRGYWVEILKNHPRFQQDFLKNKPKDVKKNPEFMGEWTFRQAAIWPDVVRGLSKKLKDKYHIGSWHYVNLPIYLNQKFDTQHINTDKKFHGVLKSGINVIQATQGHIENLLNPQATKEQQAFALSWILHTIADAHQPTHCSSLASENYFPKGDRGGNDIPVKGQGRMDNLHWFWDSTLHSSTAFKVISRRAEWIAEKQQPHLKNYQADDIQNWIEDCLVVAKKHVYTPDMLENIRRNEKLGNPVPVTVLSEEYAQNARKVAEKQALKAALEIKSILDKHSELLSKKACKDKSSA